MSRQAVVCGGFLWPSSRDCGISPFSCSPPSLGIILELHAHAEGMRSCRGKERGKEGGGDPALAGGALDIQPGIRQIQLCGVSSTNQ